jgi:DNA-binding NtrC family response regulator
MTEPTATYRIEIPREDLALYVSSSPAKLVPLRGRSVTIGRDTSNDVVILDRTVSARHCQISDDGLGYRVRDLNSRNGTQLNGVRITTGKLRPGCRLEIGRAALLCVPQTAASSSVDEAERMVGSSPAMEALQAELACFAIHAAPVLLLGESGTGKELAARAIHRLSAQRNEPFVAINCGALPKELAMSELFGHVKGAFTGAAINHRGAFERAHLGTLFLDEIGELEPALQTSLLRVLETKTIKKLGSETEISVNARIVAATNRDLLGAIPMGRFRADLYHRLAVLKVSLPPLRERLEDIPLLARALLARTNTQKELSTEALEVLSRHSWPGNVRELRNMLERASALSMGPQISADDLRFDLVDLYRVKDDEQALLEIIDKYHGNVTAAARELCISRTTLRDRLYKIRDRA